MGMRFVRRSEKYIRAGGECAESCRLILREQEASELARRILVRSHSIDRATSVVADIDGPVWRNCQPDRSTHPFAVTGFTRWKPPTDEIRYRFRFSTVIHFYPDDLIAGGHAAVPGSMKSHK